MSTQPARKKSGKGATVLVVFILGFVLVIVGIALGPGLYLDWQQQKVLENGVEAPATIVDIIDTGNRWNDNPEVRILLSVDPENGDAYETEQHTVLSAVDLVKWKPGQSVRVKYDPDDPDVVAIIGLW